MEEELRRSHGLIEMRVEGRTKGMAEANERLQPKICERKKTEEMLGRQAALLDLTYDNIMVRDMDNRIVFWNRGAEEGYGWTKEEVLGEIAHTLLQTQFPKSLEEIEAELIRNGRWESELVRTKRDGTRIVVASRWALQRDESGKPVAILEISNNVTDRKRMGEEKIKLAKLESLGVLAGGIAHDFNNLLSSLLITISFLRTNADSGTDIHESFIEVEKMCHWAKRLTQQLLTFSKGGAPIKKLTSIERMIRESSGFALRGSSVRCEFRIEEGLWYAEVDEGQVSQAVTNLVINAVQAMPKGGVITIRAENVTVGTENFLPLKDGMYVKITIEDEGIGMPEENLSKVFDPYFATRGRGSGLGLATSYSIVKSHDGHIGVESELGEGTRFYVYLPASARRVEEREAAERGLEEGGRILIMDDEMIIAAAAGEALRGMGYDVEYAEDGSKAVELYKRAKEVGKPFDVLIMDLTIPGGVGGEETIGELINVDPGVRAIVSSGYSNDPVMAEFTKYGFRGVVSKPYDVEELVDTIQKVMNEGQLGV